MAEEELEVVRVGSVAGGSRMRLCKACWAQRFYTSPRGEILEEIIRKVQALIAKFHTSPIVLLVVLPCPQDHPGDEVMSLGSRQSGINVLPTLGHM
jgi:hypothetical protein